MSMLDVTPKDVMRGTVYDPAGWYTVRVDNVGELTPSKNGESMNILIEGTILKNADSGDEKYAGFPTPFWLFNSKAPGFAVGFLRALGEEVVPGRVNLKIAEGRILDVFIQNNEHEGKITSKVDHQYRPTRG